MSVASEIARLQSAKADIKTAIEGKGVTVPSSTKLDGYADLVDAIQQGTTPTGTINIISNGTYNVTDKATARVTVPNSYSAADEGKVVSNGALVAQGSDTVTQNGTVDTTLINSLTVAVAGSAEQPTTHATVTAETDLKAFLTDHPISLKYSSEICWLRFYSDTAASTGGTANWVQFWIDNLTKKCILTNYKNSAVAANTLAIVETINASNPSYFGLSDYKITSSSSTNTSRKIAAGTVAKVLHVPFNWSTFALDAQAL